MDRTRRGLGARAAVAISLAMWIVLPSRAAAVDLSPTLKAARDQAEADRPVVLIFSATWCGWCRKFSAATLDDPQVKEIEDQFLWVKVDADESPELTARYRVRGLPHTVVLDSQDRLLGTQPGYQSPEDLIAFLKRALDNPEPIEVVPAALLAELDALEQQPDRAAVVRRAVTRLCRSDAADRALLQEALIRRSALIATELTELLEAEELAIRAAAWGTLQRIGVGDCRFDPFGSPESRAVQRAACERYLSGIGASGIEGRDGRNLGGVEGGGTQ